MNIVDPIIGTIPIKKPPSKKEKIFITVDGLPPAKNLSISIRNKKSKDFESFKKLRLAGLKAMKGRRWYDGPIKIFVTYLVPDQGFRMIGKNYIGGILDTLGGSHGFTFTYLPIVYQDDYQFTEGIQIVKLSKITHYTIDIEFF